MRLRKRREEPETWRRNPKGKMTQLKPGLKWNWEFECQFKDFVVVID